MTSTKFEKREWQIILLHTVYYSVIERREYSLPARVIEVVRKWHIRMLLQAVLYSSFLLMHKATSVRMATINARTNVRDNVVPNTRL